MNSSSFLRADGTIEPQHPAWWAAWLPTLDQIQQAVQLQFDPRPNARTSVWAISMRQGLGLVVVAALVAGFLPFLVNSIIAIRMGTVLPLAEFAQEAQEQSAAGGPLALMSQTWQTLAGLSPAVFPGWLAAILTSLGEWINWPLRWLTWWLVYGTAVLVAAKAWGAPTTLQQFFALTSYASVPMVLTALGPIPFLGFLAQLVAVVWMIMVYIASVRAVTGLDWGRAAISVVLPGAIALLLGVMVLLATAMSVLQMVF
jgi:hypothetical protein